MRWTPLSVLHVFLAVCPGVAHATTGYHLATLHRIFELEQAFEIYREKKGRDPPLEGARTWVSCLLWDVDEADWGLLGSRSLRAVSSVADPTLESRPGDAVVLDDWGNPIIALKNADGLLLYSRGHDEIDDKGMRDDISNRWGIRYWYYGGKRDAVLGLKIAAGLLALALATWCVRKMRKRSS